LFSDLHITDDPTTLVLLVLIASLFVLPGALWIIWKVSRPPFGAETFRSLYLAWTLLLAAASVWNLSRDVRLSVDEAGTDNFVRAGFLLLGALIIILVGARYRFHFLKELQAGALGLFFVFALWGLASTLWSVAPASTLYKSAEYCTMLGIFALAIFLVLSTFRDLHSRLLALKSVFDWQWFLLLLLIASVYIGMLIWPEHAFLHAYRDQSGILGFSIQGALPGLSANSVADVAGIIGVVALIRILEIPTSRAFYVPVFLLMLLTMVLTQSRSPMLAFLIASGAVLVVSGRFLLLAMFGTALGALLLTPYTQLAYTYLARGQDEQGLYTLTGRVTWWKASLQAVQDNWVYGYGANAGGRYALQSVLGEEVSTAHSSWMEIVLDTGVVGLILFLIGLLTTWVWLLRLRLIAMEHPISRLLWFESLGVLTLLCVRSVFSVNLVWSYLVLSLGTVLVFIGVVRRQVVQGRNAGFALAQPLPAGRRRRRSIRR
jgi:exopolysaccharide production protein ExoQ